MKDKNKYEEALEIARGIINNANRLYADALRKDLTKILPELKESDDEKIRKEIITFIKKRYRSGCDYDYDKWIDWLEKQGGQKHYSKMEKYINCQFNYTGYCNGTCILGEEKVEPKFKQGKWIVWKDKHYKVNYNGCGYELLDQNGLSIYRGYKTIEDNAHLWTITDAKDGDVLAVNNEVFIYSHRKLLHAIVVAHCFVDSVSGFYFGGEFLYIEKGNSIHPATKEQCDALMKAMTDAGYIFDFEKKELKKIEQKPEEKPFISLKDFQETFELKARQYDIELPDRRYDIHAMCKELYSLLIKQKYAWSEEDTFKVQRICKYLDEAKKYYADITEVREFIDWLKSLKERIKPQWKPIPNIC